MEPRTPKVEAVFSLAHSSDPDELFNELFDYAPIIKLHKVDTERQVVFVQKKLNYMLRRLM